MKRLNHLISSCFAYPVHLISLTPFSKRQIINFNFNLYSRYVAVDSLRSSPTSSITPSKITAPHIQLITNNQPKLGKKILCFPPIKTGSAFGSGQGKRFSKTIKKAAKAENPTKTCVYCRRPGTAIEVDHVIPKSKGGTNKLENAQLTCHDCNHSKGNGNYPKKPPDDYVGPWPPLHWPADWNQENK